jgi:hypothetical protein
MYLFTLTYGEKQKKWKVLVRPCRVPMNAQQEGFEVVE